MPATSEAQRRAMEAAAHGHSTLGIPKKVGAAFVGDAADVKHAAGVVHVAPDGDVLLLRRASTEENYAGYWSLPGGKADAGETPEEAAGREVEEEIGKTPNGKMRLIDRRATPNGFIFSTFAKPVEDKFVPVLNGEHSGYCWAPLHQLPMPMHPAVAEVLGPHLGLDPNAPPGIDPPWQAAGANFAAWARDFVGAQDSMALDKESVRTIDKDGHLHVSRTPISKAVVNGYLGNEIPDWEALGLDATKIYQLYRDPAELKKSAATFARKPILVQHTPISAGDHPHEITVGTIGDDVEFDAPFLVAPLTIWDQAAIDLIESGEQRELSCGYRYRPVMVAGTTPDGEPYDGRMTQIEANHLALVSRGRAGPDVVVGDSALSSPSMENSDMAKTTVVLSRHALLAHGALTAQIMPLLAKDAKIDLTTLLAGVKDFDKERPAILAAVTKATAGKLAKDAKLGNLGLALDAAKAADADMPKNAADEEGGGSKKAAFLKEKLSAEDMKAYDEMDDDQEAMDEDDDESKGKKGAEDEDDDDAKKKGAEDEDEPKVDKKAMDAAITVAVRETEKRVMRTQREIRTAEEEVAPYVGKLAIACDSAADVYKAALGALKVDVAGMHPTAFRPVLLAQPKPGAKQEQRQRETTVAMDSASVASFQAMFPKAQPVRRV
jgi:8-oxo-dGTP pyrophosphatase MutT (NUDIX family)